MTDQDHAADEQAREVEVVARVIAPESFLPHHDQPFDDHLRESARRRAREILAALEPIRAAERQEAAREALLAAADAMEQRAWTEVQVREADLLRDHADGVTGRSET